MRSHTIASVTSPRVPSNGNGNSRMTSMRIMPILSPATWWRIRRSTASESSGSHGNRVPTRRPSEYSNSPTTPVYRWRSAAGIVSQCASMRSSAVGVYQSSESRIAKYRPRAISTPRLVATCLPPFGWYR